MRRLRMLISDGGGGCGGHRAAMSSNRLRCSSVRRPARAMSHSIRSSFLSFVSHSAQSEAWFFECRRLTVTSSSGRCFRRAYSAQEIVVDGHRLAADEAEEQGGTDMVSTWL